MKRAVFPFLLVLAACSSPEPPPEPEPEPDLFDRISVDLAGHDLSQVVVMIGNEVGVKIRTTPDVNEAVWLTAIEAEWPVVLEALAAQARCVVEEQGDGSLLLSHPADAPPRDARKILEAIAAWERVHIAFDEGFGGEVISDLRDLSVEDAVKQVLADAGKGYRWVVKDRDHWRIARKKRKKQ